MPAALTRAAGTFALHDGTPLIVHATGDAGQSEAHYFADLVQHTHGIRLDARADASQTSGTIVFEIGAKTPSSDDPDDESYQLDVDASGVHAQAATTHGLFNAAITLWQLLAASGDNAHPTLPYVHIQDRPRFRWRGVMLDSARHFQTPEEIERVLDQMAQLKLNVLHWHLTDDQGWRIEIKKYPRLTQIGAWRNEAAVNGAGAKYGGFYTQTQIRAIVAYASARHITVMPEIEMPGHAQAAIAAYPELGVGNRHPKVSHDWGVHTYLYNVDDRTFAFLENVLGEVLDLFPSHYIHVGGDEAAKDQWQASAAVQKKRRALGIADDAKLQGWFTARIERWLAAHGRALVGWDEILEGGVPARAVVMSWRGTEGGIAAAQSGHDVIMSPSPQLYFDHVQSTRPDEPPGRPDPVTLADVYNFEPVAKELDANAAQHVLGAQANLWSEYLDSPARVEHAAFPRVAALAEALWTPAAARNWDDFRARLPAQMQRYRRADIAAADSELAAPIAANPAARSSDQLKPCKDGGLALRLPGPAFDKDPGTYRVDLFDPCWIDPQVDFSTGRTLEFTVGALPYNFQLWHDAKNVVQRRPAGHLQVRLDGCDGTLLADRTLERGAAAAVQRVAIPLPAHSGAHDLCIRLTRTDADPLWALGRVEIAPN
jgi:hexosaminidase